jgi:hypothetical protein
VFKRLKHLKSNPGAQNTRINDKNILLNAGGKIETNEVGRACGAYGGG